MATTSCTRLARVPLDAVGHLQDGEAGGVDEVAVLEQAVGDGDAAAEVGVGDLLPTEHRVGVLGGDVAVLDQQPGGAADRVLLVGDRLAEADRGFRQGDHVRSVYR